MKIVVDTNILFSALLRSDNRYANTIIKNPDGHHFFGVYFTIVELFKHKERIVKFSNLSEDDVLEALYELLKNIHFVNDQIISEVAWRQSMQLVFDIDVKDLPNVALSIELGAKIWTSDAELKNGLRAKGFDEFYEP